ncbi:hypothetical protein ACWD4J_43960, partial [Streptomyces sp. NPDC002577]
MHGPRLTAGKRRHTPSPAPRKIRGRGAGEHPATERAVNVLAPNASAMTLDGTNTWIVSEPD